MLVLAYDGELADVGHEEYRRDRRLRGNDSCFPGDARVLTPTGYQRIDGLVSGSPVMTFDTERGVLLRSSVKTLIEYPPATVYEVQWGAGKQVLRVTGSHSLRLATGSWEQVRRLTPRSRLLAAQGDGVEITSIRRLDRPEAVYNLYPYGNKTFVVEGLVAHSFTNYRVIRDQWHRAMEALQSRVRVRTPALAR